MVVVFRGSVTPRDFLMNGLFLRTMKNNPDEIKSFASNGTKIQSGFLEYLFGTKNGQVSKYQQIFRVLKELYAYKDEASGRDYSEYELFITGHSLGGALSQLLAFVLAGSEETNFLPTGKPVIAMTYASPEVGNSCYQETFTKLEKQKTLRHLRVTNDGDVVPFGYNFIAPFLDYKQTGVNIHLFENGLASVERDRIFMSSVDPFTFIDMHDLYTYKSRLFNEENKVITSMNIEDFYSDF